MRGLLFFFSLHFGGRTVDRIILILRKKTTWVGIGLVATGIGELVAGGDVGQACSTIGTGLAVIFGRAAIAKIEHSL